VIADTTAVTLSAQMITLPIILFHMNQINTAGLISNIIIIPVITIIMGISLFGICISFVSTTAAAFSGCITDFIFKLSLIFIEYICNMELNFFVYNVSIVLLLIILTGFIPLINIKPVQKMKFYPVIISIILCTFYLKKYNYFTAGNFILYAGNSRAEVKIEDKKQILKLSLSEGADVDNFITSIKMRNPDIKIIELENTTKFSIAASKKLMNDYIIDEFRIETIPDLNTPFKKMIFQLEKDNVIINFKKAEF
jgi:competence protein ComEC